MKEPYLKKICQNILKMGKIMNVHPNCSGNPRRNRKKTAPTNVLIKLFKPSDKEKVRENRQNIWIGKR
jgi:hypothetical protein